VSEWDTRRLYHLAEERHLAEVDNALVTEQRTPVRSFGREKTTEIAAADLDWSS
jgi:hypothetical protein